MALPHEVHVDVNRAQKNFDARSQKPIDNINTNADILYNHPKIPNKQVDQHLEETLKHYNKTTKGKK